MRPDIVSDLLVNEDEAKARLEARLACLDDVRRGRLDQVSWYDDTMNELEAIFASKAKNYFFSEGGFRFIYSSIKGRIFKSANLDRSQGILRRMIDGLAAASSDAPLTGNIKPSNKIFIVHGHDEKRLLEVKEILTSQDLLPIILKNEPNGGATVIEKFERNSDVGFAVVLFTADDLGSVKAASDQLSPRARQNVVLELGYFIGKLTRARICALNDHGIELPSDIHGIVYTELDAGGAWRYKLLDELKYAGYAVDKNKL